MSLFAAGEKRGQAGIKEKLYFQAAGALQQDAQRACASSFPGAFESLPGCLPEQPALGDLASAGDWIGGPPEGPSDLHHPVINSSFIQLTTVVIILLMSSSRARTEALNHD